MALKPQRPVALLSGPGAGIYAGAGWWRALVAAACAAQPGVPVIDILDCADAPGRALEALRLGQGWLVLAPSCPAFATVADVAAAVGATLLRARPPALDLAGPRAAARLAAWLTDGATSP